MSSMLWELGKKASIAGLVFVSIPVLVPSALVLAFALAVLAVPVASAAVGFVLVKKILGKNYLEWSFGSASSSPRLGSVRDDGEVEKEMLENQDKHDQAGASSSSSSSSQDQKNQAPDCEEIACEEAPEVKASEDYIVVEKPVTSHSLVEFEHQEEEGRDGDKLKKTEAQCKSAPDFFQCLEADIAEKEIGGADTRVDDDGGRAQEDGDEKDKDACTNNKHQGVGLSVILEEADKKPSPENLEEGSGAKNKENAAAPDGEETHHVVENGDFGIVEDGHDRGKEEPRSSVDDYVSMTEDFPEETAAASSDESVTSAGKSAAAATAAKPEVKTSRRSRKRRNVLGFAKRLLRLRG